MRAIIPVDKVASTSTRVVNRAKETKGANHARIYILPARYGHPPQRLHRPDQGHDGEVYR